MHLNSIYSIIFLSFFGITILLKIMLDFENYLYRKKIGDKIPEGFENLIDKNKLNLINNYSNEKIIFSLAEFFFEKTVLLLILFLGIIPFYKNFLNNYSNNFYAVGLLFFAGFFLFQTIIGIPFDIFLNFKIEKKYNFNKMTFKLWIIDFIKKIIITIILGVLILLPLLFFLHNFQNIWWLFLWGFMIILSLVIQIIYPSIIAPLFNKFKPLEDIELNKKIELLLNKTGFKSNGVFEMDASKRSTHSNAYFTGFGKTKRIVLYDVLLKNHNHDEILSILAHELGHFKYKHVLINMLIFNLGSLIGLYIANALLNNIQIYYAFGFDRNINIENIKFIGLFLISILLEPAGFFFNPLTNIISKIFEHQADKYAFTITKSSKPLVNALKKLSIENLSDIYPSPLYAWFYYSHPAILQRIKNLNKLEQKS